MRDVMGIIDKANVKELVALALGGTAGRFLNNAISKFITDENQKTLARVAIGLVGAYVANDFAEKNPRYAEVLSLAGLAATAIAAQPIEERLTAEVSAATGSPIKIVASSSNPNPQPVNVIVSSDPNPQPVSVSVSASAGSRRSVVASI